MFVTSVVNGKVNGLKVIFDRGTDVFLCSWGVGNYFWFLLVISGMLYMK